jgi:methyltransferase (TIGR00027 family)
MWIIYQLTVRTKHIDATLAEAARDGARQVVVLGAGFDTRAHRFHKEFPGLRFFEVDLPDMVAVKEKWIGKGLGAQACQVAYVPIDFEKQNLDQELTKAGFKKDLKTLFIWEGVVYYLDEASVSGTLRSIARNSTPGSLVIFDYIPPEVADGTTTDPYGKLVHDHVKSLGEPWKSGVKPTGMAEYLARQGLELKANRGPDYMLKHYLTGSDGKPGGTLPTYFWMATAMVPAR